MASPIHVYRPTGLPIILWLAMITAACSVSPTPRETTEQLVSTDAPVFDKRFQEVSFEDIDLKNFWVSRSPQEPRENIPIHNNTYSDITDSVKSAVVNIYALRVEERDAQFGLSPNDILPFRIPLVSAIIDFLPFKVPVPYRTEGFSLGSGFIMNSEGYILTNAHVINNATDIRVGLSDRKQEYHATIIGADPVTDSALIKIEPDHDLNILPLGDSDELKMGEMVLAIGNPLGLQHTVTSGLVSAKERVAPHLNDKYVDFLQTDSAINPGSSGGPLINLYGEVVGVNTAIVSGAQLIGFAVPINTIKEVMPMLILGKTERGWFGARAIPLTYRQAVELGYEEDGGVVIMDVARDSPAAEAGLQSKDIIVELNGQKFNNFFIFRRKLLGLAPGSKISLTVFRNGETLEIQSRLIRKPVEKDQGNVIEPEDEAL